MNTKKRKIIARLKKDSAGYRGIYLYDEDIILMKQLLIHQTMRSTSIHELLQLLSKGQRSKSSISNRLGKLGDAGILVQMKEVRAGNFYTYHQRLGKRGVEALVDLKIISREEGDRAYENSRKVSFPSEHTISTSIVANRTFMTCLQNEGLAGITHTKGSMHTKFGNPLGEASERRGMIIPDWVFENRDTYVCIEVDTGTQREHMLSRKMEWYIKQAKTLNAKGKKLVVVFSIVDKSVVASYSDNRKKRIASLKEMMPPFSEWSEDKEELNELGLYFYVVSANRTPPLVERILSYMEPLSPIERHQYADDWKRHAENILQGEYVVESIDKDESFGVRRNREVDCNALISLRSTRPRGDDRIHAVIYGEEGSVITYQLIRANAIRITTLNDTKQHPKASLLICYDEQIPMIEDVYGLNTGCDLWYTDTESWENGVNEERGVPEVMFTVTQFKKEWRRFDE